MTTNSVLNHYSGILKNWPKEAGPKPTAADLEKVHATGSRPGSKATFALAMYLREHGATSKQITAAVKSPQLNKMRHLVDSGVLKKVPMARDSDGHTVYKVTLTGKTKERAKRQSKPKATNGKDKTETPPKQEAPAAA